MFLIQGGDCSTQLGEAVGLFAAGVLIASNGGGLIGVTIGICALILAGATALGYYDGKKDCIPPPCTD